MAQLKKLPFTNTPSIPANSIIERTSVEHWTPTFEHWLKETLRTGFEPGSLPHLCTRFTRCATKGWEALHYEKSNALIHTGQHTDSTLGHFRTCTYNFTWAWKHSVCTWSYINNPFKSALLWTLLWETQCESVVGFHIQRLGCSLCTDACVCVCVCAYALRAACRAARFVYSRYLKQEDCHLLQRERPRVPEQHIRSTCHFVILSLHMLN